MDKPTEVGTIEDAVVSVFEDLRTAVRERNTLRLLVREAIILLDEPMAGEGAREWVQMARGNV